MDKTVIISEIEELMREGQILLSTKWTGEMSIYTFVNQEAYYSWRTKTLTFLRMFLPEESEYVKVFAELKSVSLPMLRFALRHWIM